MYSSTGTARNVARHCNQTHCSESARIHESSLRYIRAQDGKFPDRPRNVRASFTVSAAAGRDYRRRLTFNCEGCERLNRERDVGAARLMVLY